MADIAAGTPVTEDTACRVASITKTFIAIAMLQLWEQGLVDPDPTNPRRWAAGTLAAATVAGAARPVARCGAD